jgi:hypothetical protein
VGETRVESWLELQEQLFAESWQESLGRHRSAYAFRGRDDARDDLSTTLARLGGDARVLERHLLRNFRKYAGPTEVPVDSPWNWLALGQHHGLPTRLLDWTNSPYVALHFATSHVHEFDRDGVVWMVDYAQAHELAPAPLRDCLEREGAALFTTEMLGSVSEDVGDLESLGDEFVVFVEPPSFDQRIINQYALFSLLSRPDASMDAWAEANPALVRRVLIPAELKWEVRDKLDQANVTERVLFPGLDGLTRALTRHYAPRDKR